jgi:hypothetical protein
MLKREIPVIILILFIITLSTFCVLSHTADLRTKICMATVFPFMAIYFILHEYVTVKYYQAHKDLCLEISRESDIFRVGYPGNMAVYRKSDIVEINIYGVYGKGPAITNIAELVLNNGAKIQLPGLLIPEDKLTEYLKNINVNYFRNSKNFMPVFASYGNVSPKLIKLLYLVRK